MNDRSGPRQAREHRWPTIDWPIAQLIIRIDRIAEKNGLVLEDWIEDGLGELSGCTLQLPSGLVVQLIESTHAIRHFHLRGPALYADAKDVHLAGIDPVLSDALAVLGLNPTDVEWTNQAPTATDVAGFEKAGAKSSK
jgi:hypothetical protein